MTNPVMVAYEKSNMTSIPTTAPDVEEGLARETVFQQLQPFCSRLLFLRESIPALAAMLQCLKAVLSDADAAGLRGCMDYALFPLSLGVDSVAATRQPGAHAVSAEAPHILRPDCHSCCNSLRPMINMHGTYKDQILSMLSEIIMYNASTSACRHDSSVPFMYSTCCVTPKASAALQANRPCSKHFGIPDGLSGHEHDLHWLLCTSAIA